MDLSPEERERRSQRAKELIKDGKFGGPQPGSGRPRKKRASEIVAEAAIKEADQITDAFRRGVDSDDPKTAVMAAEKWLNVEGSEADRQEKEERRLDRMSKDDVIAQLAEGFARLRARGITFDYEGEATEVLPAELPDGED